MDIQEQLALMGGVVDTATSALISNRRLQLAVRRGELIRVRRGCYALPSADPLRVAEVAWRGFATCVSAAVRNGLPVLEPDSRYHLVVARSRTFSGGHLQPPANVVVHWADEPRDSLASALDHTATCLPLPHQAVIVDAALRRGLIDQEDVQRFTKGTRRRRTWLAANCEPSAESPLETLLRIELRALGLPVRAQVAVTGVGRVDFLIGDRLIVEVDGREYHSDPFAFANDRRRDRAAVARGYSVLRFTYGDIVGDASAAAREVLDVFLRMGVA